MGILPSALRASLRLCKIALDDFGKLLDFIARRAALVPKPRVNLTRYHGVFAPNSAQRAAITPSQRGKGGKNENRTATVAKVLDDKSYMEKRAAMTWAQRLKRVFNIEIEVCRHCQGPVKIIACIEDPAVIERILACLYSKADVATIQTGGPLLPMPRAPPAENEWLGPTVFVNFSCKNRPEIP